MASNTQGAFAATSRFKAAISIFNQLESPKLAKVATMILTRMTERKSGSTFSETETEQLKAVLELSSSDVDIFVSGCSYVWDQAAFSNLSPDKLEPQLLEHGANQSAVDVMKSVWADGRVAFINALRERTLGAPQTLDAVNWRLQLTMSHKELSKTKAMSAILGLSLGDVSDPDKAQEQVLLEMSKDQLSQLYNDLERVQAQLDKITK